MIPSRAVLGVLLILTTAPGIARTARIGDCPEGRFAPNLSSAAGLPFDDGSSAGGTLVVADGVITLGACLATPAPYTVVQHRRFWRARWETCGPFTRVRLRIGLGPGGRCDYLIGVIRFRDSAGHRRAFKFPA